MKINKKILSIPPHLSTEWTNVSSMRMEGSDLIVNLHDGDTIRFPAPNQQLVEILFNTHAQILEMVPVDDQSMPEHIKVTKDLEQQFRISLGFYAPDSYGSATAHNKAHADAPDLPLEFTQKISAIFKIMAPAESGVISPIQAEMNCNCMYCQIARAISPGALENVVTAEEEIVADEDLTFQQWNIQATQDNLFYKVTNKLDTTENYDVCLDPVGCTCGKSSCEHIVAVLKS